MAALCWSSREEIPHVQGKRNPSKTVGVARGHQKANALKPYSQRTTQSNHTRTTALSNSMKLSHACGATQDGRVMVERSDRMWSTEESESEVTQSCPTLSDPMDYSPPGPPSMGFSRQEYWSGVPLPSPLTAAKHVIFTWSWYTW